MLALWVERREDVCHSESLFACFACFACLFICSFVYLLLLPPSLSNKRKSLLTHAMKDRTQCDWQKNQPCHLPKKEGFVTTAVCFFVFCCCCFVFVFFLFQTEQNPKQPRMADVAAQQHGSDSFHVCTCVWFFSVKSRLELVRLAHDVCVCASLTQHCVWCGAITRDQQHPPPLSLS